MRTWSWIIRPSAQANCKCDWNCNHIWHEAYSSVYDKKIKSSCLISLHQEIVAYENNLLYNT